MNCINCEVPIDPRFRQAILANSCPSCGKNIMDEPSFGLLSELKEAITKMADQSPDALANGLAGWILSNYRLTKIGEAAPSQFYTPSSNKKAQRAEEERKLKIADNPVQKFLKRTGMSKDILRQRELAELANNIGQVEEPEYDPTEEEIEAELYPEDYETEEEDQYVPAEKISRGLVNASLVDPSVRPLDKKTLKNLAAAVAGNQDDADTGVSALNIERMKRLQAQQELRSTGSVGKIKRSD